jgi:threonine dehydratase
MNAAILSCEAIAQAHATIDAVFLNTPQFELDALNTLLNTRLILKVETLNPIRSFKGRGTDCFVKQHAQQPPLSVPQPEILARVWPMPAASTRFP